jgi:hypothetical protein
MSDGLLLAKQTADSFGDYGIEWLYLAAPLLIGAAVIAYLFATGQGRHPLGRVSSSLERLTGLPSYAAGGIGMGVLALVVAVLGFYWDVAWHIELGRDEFIFTPAHLGILLGLTLIACAGLTSVALATYERVPTRLRFKGIRIPFGAVPILALGFGALTGFPLDEFWHRAYGIDVTMWGPTHLVMISGASLTPLGLLVLYREGSRDREPTRFGRTVAEIIGGATVVGLSTWTGEFDFGVPQFQALYHPVLVMAGSSMALVIARKFLGPGAALRVAIGALAIRGLVALVIGAGLGLVIPRFPLYLGCALVVEAAFRYTEGLAAVKRALVTGAALGTVGFATEWVWMAFWGRHPWTLDLMPGAVLASVAAIAATLLGWAMGDVLTGAKRGPHRWHLVTAGLVLLVALALPLPRNDADVRAVLTTQPAGADRALVEIALDPADTAEGANWFEVMSWQGGAVEVHPLERVGRGRYAIDEPIPVTGDWKTVVRLAKDDTVIGTGVYLPADPAIGAKEIPLEPRREIELVRDTEFLMREAREGAAGPAIIAYTAILILAVVWIAALIFSYSSLESGGGSPRGRRVRSAHRVTA